MKGNLLTGPPGHSEDPLTRQLLVPRKQECETGLSTPRRRQPPLFTHITLTIFMYRDKLSRESDMRAWGALLTKMLTH